MIRVGCGDLGWDEIWTVEDLGGLRGFGSGALLRLTHPTLDVFGCVFG